MGSHKNEKISIWQKIGLFFFDRKAITLALWLVVVVFGALSYTTLMKREGFPSVNVPLGVVQVVSFERSAREVDEKFALPITQAAKNDSRVEEVSSTSTDQGSAIQITFQKGTNVENALGDLKKNVEGTLPTDAQVVYIPVQASKLTTEGDDILLSVHSGDLSTESLDAAAAELGRIIDEKVALSQKTNVYPIVETIADPVSGETRSQQVRFDRFYSLESGRIERSVAVGVVGVPGVDQLELYDQVQAALGTNEVRALGVGTTIAVDFAESIREQVSGLQTNLLEGLAVVLVVSFILISLRASLVTAISMTTTIAITIGVLNLIGYSINTITLFSLVLCLALIVDDTTIVVEAIDAGLKKGRKFRQVVSESLGKVVRASATGTFTTILAFAPMLFIGGILGEFIRAIPITIIISLLVSLVVSFVFIPLMMFLSYSRKKEITERKGFVAKFEKGAAAKLADTVVWSTKTKTRSIAMKLHAVFFAVLFVVAGAVILRGVEFNIFPAPKDGTEIFVQVAVTDRENATIAATEAIADSVLPGVVEEVGDNLERMTLLAQPGASREGFTATLTLTSLDARVETSVSIAERLQDRLQASHPTLRVSVEAAGVGPPEGSFAVQIKSGAENESSRTLASDVSTYLQNLTLERIDGTTARLIDVSQTPSTVVSRNNGNEIITVSASFDAKDVSALVSLAEDAVSKEFNEQRLASYGLANDAIQFDFGQEEENQESFASMGQAAGPLFLAMIILMALLFRSVLQSFLILTALPFAFFGVAAGLALTDNPLSFFSMLGIFALVGISVNNAILLTDFANQARERGLAPAEAMADSIRARLRPLLTTSITSILALLPLALNDPFWEGLAYTLIFGLFSSTVLVVFIFPYFYLIEEGLRARVRRLFRRTS